MQLPPIAKLVSPVQKKFASEWPPPCYLWHPLFCAVALNFYFTARFDGDSKTLCFYVALCRAERRGRRRGAAGFLSDEICRIGDFTSALGILIVELKHVTLTLAILRWFGVYSRRFCGKVKVRWNVVTFDAFYDFLMTMRQSTLLSFYVLKLAQRVKMLYFYYFSVKISK